MGVLDDSLAPDLDPMAKGVRWDLDALFPTLDAAKQNLEEAVTWAKDIQARYQGKIATLTPEQMRELLVEYESFDAKADATFAFYTFRSSVDSKSQANKDLKAFVEDAGTQIGDATRFINLEWLKVPEAQTQTVLGESKLERYRPHLVKSRLYAPYMWDEVAERYWAQRGPVVAAWNQLHGDTLSELAVPFDNGTGLKDYTEPAIISEWQYNPDRSVRERAFEAFYAELGKHKKVLAKAYDSRVADKIVEDRLRGFASPMAEMNLYNGLTETVVSNLITSIEAHRSLAREWWQVKAQAMGLPKLSIYDQAYPLGSTRKVTYAESKELIRRAMTNLSPEAYDLIKDIYPDKRIDAESRDGKRGGAYCHPGLGDGRSWVLTNFQGQMGDVFTEAHELGHALHNACACPKQSRFSAHPPLVLAEIASTMNEMALFDELMRTETDPNTRLALVSQKISGTIGTVFRQATMHRFEEKCFALRLQKQELTDDRQSDIWWETQRDLFGGAVEMPDAYRLGPFYVGHFIGTPFYVHSYAFADNCKMALYHQSKVEGPAFWPKYKNFLAAGGSMPTDQLLATVGIDIYDPHCWDGALQEFGHMVGVAKNMIASGNARTA